MVSFPEAEEGIGHWWHRRVGERSSYPIYQESAVAFEDVAGMLGVLFRGLGGDPGIQLSSHAPVRSGHRLTLRQRLGRAEETLDRPCLRGDKLLLPQVIAAFPDPQLNRELYLWSAAFLAVSEPLESGGPNAVKRSPTLTTVSPWGTCTAVERWMLTNTISLGHLISATVRLATRLASGTSTTKKSAPGCDLIRLRSR